MLGSIQRVCSILMISCAVLLAHQDDSGEVHPNVFVKDGKFEIFFKNNQSNLANKAVYSSEGKELTRKVIERKKHEHEL